MPDFTKAQIRILTSYCKFVVKHNRPPTRKELTVLGVTRDSMRNAFINLANLHQKAQEYKPEAFKNIVDHSIFTEARFTSLREKAKAYKNFIITTAVTGCKVDSKFHAALEFYCKKHNALLLILPSSDPAAVASNGTFIDPIIKDADIVYDDLQLNSNLFISSIKLSAKHIDPITGLGRIGQRDGSFIFASPKQRLKMVATSNTGMPHALITTGALTKPDYSPVRYMSHRTASIATADHKIGAIVVNVQDDKVFHFRQLQADATGAFVDLGVLYAADGSTKTHVPQALVLGDWHSGETDASAVKALITDRNSLTNRVKPVEVVIHDGFNGKAISHHEDKNRVKRNQLAAAQLDSLEDEINAYAKDLHMLAGHFKRVNIIDSNHDDFLERYLREGRFVDDARNAKYASTLFYHMCDGLDPLRVAVEKSPALRTASARLNWLSRDQDYKIAGIELAAHGDLGANGSRGSTKQMEAAYGSSVSGHSHTMEILRDAWVVGTSSILRPDYVRGASSWTHTSCLVYPCGRRQLITVINGKYIP